MMSYEPILECTFGWGQLLRLYPDYLDIQGVSYALADLIQFKPVYRRLIGMASMRLELQFKSAQVVVRGIADMDAALKLLVYLNSYCPVREDEPGGRALSPLRPVTVNAPALVLPDATQGRFWEYCPSSNEQPTLYAGPFDAVVDDSRNDESSAAGERFNSSVSLPAMIDAVPGWPWTDERHAQHIERLQSLQAAREVHLHGFDVEELARRLKELPLPVVMVPIHLPPGEVAHYATSSMLSDISSSRTSTSRQDRFKARDRGMFILTNKRVIYLGRKHQMVVGYEHLVQASYIPGAIVLFAAYWPDRKFFAMKRPLECSMYFEHILQKFQQSFLSGTSQVRAFSTAACPPAGFFPALMTYLHSV